MFNDVNQEDYLKTIMMLENGSYFAEYFYTIGLNHELLFDNNLYIENVTLLNRNRRVKPEVITRFPNIAKRHISLSEDMLIKVSIG
jgi:hypothetical protein